MRIAVLPIVIVLIPASSAFAHHPGSHAARLPDGRVSLDAVAMATDACTRVGEVRTGAPQGVASVAGNAPVTVRLERSSSGPCAAVLSAVHRKVVLDVAHDVRQILLYVVAPDGTTAATERVPVR